MPKRLVLLLAAVLAACSPIVVFSTPGWWSKITMSLPQTTSPDSFGTAQGGVTESWAPDVPQVPSAAERPLRRNGALMYDLAEVLRFDVTPDWIVSRWPRVSAGLAHLPLQGYRVPLVTGIAQDDVAGSLTYYFNAAQQLQRITFSGTTGNTRKLVALITSRFGFARRLVNDASVFLYELPDSDGRATSFLWIRPARVVRAMEPHRRFEVAFVIERPQKPS
jgi:hypothetical protein